MNSMIKCAAGICTAALFALAANAQGEGSAGQATAGALARELAPARLGARISVTSPAFTSRRALDERFTQNGANMSPPLEWTRGPTGTQSYVIVAEDPAVSGEPIVHWIVYNIPSTVRNVPQEMPAETTLRNGALQGKNASGSAAYLGPKPPAGQTHPYHFQVFALNTRLNIDPASADRATVINAMKGRVVASGEVVGTYTGR